MAEEVNRADALAEMEQILRRERVGYLGLSAEGTPYVVPLNYAYTVGRLLFHCALTGKKLDYLRSNRHVCLAVGSQVGSVERHSEGGACHPDCDSVICYGVARVIEDLEERRKALDEFSRILQPGAEEISPESAARCLAVEIVITEMTGRRERSRERTYWRHQFHVDEGGVEGDR